MNIIKIDNGLIEFENYNKTIRTSFPKNGGHISVIIIGMKDVFSRPISESVKEKQKYKPVPVISCAEVRNKKSINDWFKNFKPNYEI